MRSANLFFFSQPQETFQEWLQAQQNTPFEEKVEQFFVEFQQIPINYGTITDTAYQDSLYWKEQHLYGSSRLGIAKPELEVTNYTPSNASKLTTNFRNYELTNHLGNILATIKDEKQQIDQNADGIVDYYEPIVITANDYYPFGIVMSNRSFSLGGNNYRFGFNGKEDDSEINGQQDYGLRIYNKLLGRFLSVDPLSKKFAYYTPYQFAGNTPIGAMDLDGAEAMVVTIRDMVTDPALKQVNLQKLTAKAEQANLTVEYRYQDASGNLTRVECFDSYKQGTVEAQMANQTNSAGVRTEDRLRAGSYNSSNRFVDNSIQDPQSNPSVNNGRMLTANNGFQYDLNIQYKPDGARLNEADLKAGTLPNVQNQIANAQTTLNNNSIPYIGFNGQNKVANMQQYNITVVGQTDGNPSNYVGNTPGNTQPQGNPALAQDRANNVRSSLGTMSGRTLNTSTVNNSGSSNQENRSTKLLITR